MISYCRDCQKTFKLPATQNIVYDYTCEKCKRPHTLCFFYGGACWSHRPVVNKYEVILRSLLRNLLRAFAKYNIEFDIDKFSRVV